MIENRFRQGSPLPGTTMPFGRQREESRIRDATRDVGAVRVIGQRRAGKTSLLNYLKKSTRERLVLSLSLQGQSQARPIRTPAALARALMPDLPDSPNAHLGLERCLVDETTPPLILLDEVGYFADAESDLWPWLRSLGQNCAAIVYFGSRRDWSRVDQHVQAVGASFGNDSPCIELRPFKAATATRFLTETAPQGSIASEHVDWVVKTCEGWPFYLQVMGYTLVDAHRFNDPIPDLAALYKQALLVGWNGAFVSLWNDHTPEAHALLLKQLDRMILRHQVRLPQPDPKDPAFAKTLIDHDLFHETHGWLVDGPFQDWLLRNRRRLVAGTLL